MNDHQLEFVEKVLNVYNLTVITNISDLNSYISNFDERKKSDLKSKNNLFMEKFIDMINQLMETGDIKYD